MTSVDCYCCETRDPGWKTVLPVDLHPVSPQLAAYMWRESGGESPLCIDCCAEWRLFATTHPEHLIGLTVTQIQPTR